WLNLAGASVPEHMQGTIFLGPQVEPERDTHFAYRARMDETHDMVRAVRDKRYLYIRNLYPHTPRGQHIGYLWRQASMQAWEKAYLAGQTNEITGRFFHPKPPEELYDCQADPDNVQNLATDPRYADRLRKMREECQRWQLEVFDTGLLPEAEMVTRAASNHITIYEMIRDENLVDLAAYLEAVDLVRTTNANELDAIRNNLQHSDSVIRFWGTMAASELAEEARPLIGDLEKLLDDRSPDVAASAAAALCWVGDEEKGRAALVEAARKNNHGLAATLLRQIR
ncbi:MAG: hypothetical protein N2C12_06455, partial [Planctomycetales bacterium]